MLSRHCERRGWRGRNGWGREGNVTIFLVCYVCQYIQSYLCVPCYTKCSKRSHITNPWLLLPHSWSSLSRTWSTVSVSFHPCDRPCQTLSIKALPSGSIPRSEKPCSWADSPAAPVSWDFSHVARYTGCILVLISQHSVASCIRDNVISPEKPLCQALAVRLGLSANELLCSFLFLLCITIFLMFGWRKEQESVLN